MRFDYDVNAVIHDVVHCRGEVAEFVRVLSSEWATVQIRRRTEEAFEALVAAERRDGASIRTLTSELRMRVADPRWIKLLDLSSKARMQREAERRAELRAGDVHDLAESVRVLRQTMVDKAGAAGGGSPAGGGAGQSHMSRAGASLVSRYSTAESDGGSAARDLQQFVATHKRKALAEAKRAILLEKSSSATA